MGGSGLYLRVMRGKVVRGPAGDRVLALALGELKEDHHNPWPSRVIKTKQALARGGW
jgi:hypothetical protein